VFVCLSSHFFVLQGDFSFWCPPSSSFSVIYRHFFLPLFFYFSRESDSPQHTFQPPPHPAKHCFFDVSIPLHAHSHLRTLILSFLTFFLPRFKLLFPPLLVIETIPSPFRFNFFFFWLVFSFSSMPLALGLSVIWPPPREMSFFLEFFFGFFSLPAPPIFLPGSCGRAPVFRGSQRGSFFFVRSPLRWSVFVAQFDILFSPLMAPFSFFFCTFLSV